MLKNIKELELIKCKNISIIKIFRQFRKFNIALYRYNNIKKF